MGFKFYAKVPMITQFNYFLTEFFVSQQTVIFIGIEHYWNNTMKRIFSKVLGDFSLTHITTLNFLYLIFPLCGKNRFLYKNDEDVPLQ